MAATTPRYVSFVETGRAQPSRQMVVRLARALDVPLRERNDMLLAAGFAPLYAVGPLDGPALRMSTTHCSQCSSITTRFRRSL